MAKRVGYRAAVGREKVAVDSHPVDVVVLSGQKPTVPMPDFQDAYQTQRVLAAALLSARRRSPVKISQVK